MPWLGLDIGGANLKIADGKSFANSRAFALWRHPDRLAQELRSLVAEAPECDHIVATMTGELADCFESKRKGVHAILDALDQSSDGRHTRVYLTNGKLVTTEVARRRPGDAAAANWHALASFSSRFVPERHDGLLIDVGSTTTDVIRISADDVANTGRTDTERMGTGELIYTGIRRSPVCAVARTVPYRERELPVAHEVFATMLDVYLILQEIQEDVGCQWTADGRPATKKFARARLARVICADGDTFHHNDAVKMATSIAEQQLARLCSAVMKVWGAAGSPDVVVISGGGEFLAGNVIRRLGWKSQVVSLKKKLGHKISLCGPAHALATMARERGLS